MDRQDQSTEPTVEQIRANIAFEQMVVAVLTGALSGGAMLLAFNVFRIVFGGWTFELLLSVLLETVFIAILIFVVGFFSSVAIGAPLFSAVEKRKRRNLWPYLVASLAVAIIAFAFNAGGLPTVGDFEVETLLVIFAPAIVIALTFTRLMRPHWRAAEKAEAEADGPIFIKLH